MGIRDNLISATLTQEQVNQVIQAISNVWKESLSFLITFNTKERNSLGRAGDEALPAMRGFIQAVLQYPEAFSAQVGRDMEEAQRDLSLDEALRPIEALANGLATAVRDTRMAARSDVTRKIYAALEPARKAAANNPGLQAWLQPLDDVLAKRALGRPARPEDTSNDPGGSAEDKN